MRKFGTALALTLGFTALFPVVQAEASTFSQAEKLITEAEKHAGALKWQISVEHTNEIKYPDMQVFNATKDSYLKAKSSITKLNSTQKKKLEERISNNVEIHYNRATAYIDAITSGRKIVDKTEVYKTSFINDPTSDKTEAAYHSLSAEIRKQATLLYRVYGQSTRKAILDKYKQPGQTELNETIYPITTKMKIDELQELIESNESQAIIGAKVEEVFGLFEFLSNDELMNVFYLKYAEVIRKDPNFLKVESEAKTFFDKYNDAYNTEDIEKVKTIFHEEYPYREGDIELALENFPVYDLRFETLAMELIAVVDDIAVVRVTETEVNEGDLEHQAMIHEVLYELKLSNGEWKLFNLEVIDSIPAYEEEEVEEEQDPVIEEDGSPVVESVY
ncbi:hypothetical protein IM538_21695 [Cytobacillus suaedae]|nr:hypothetical protein IM538_21695 [Cytobacillus suaedae]